MKTLKKLILGLSIVATLLGCDSQEKAQLRSTIDSLNNELLASKKVDRTLEEIGTLIDSIDASHRMLSTKMVEGTSYVDYVRRLREINTYIQSTEKKLSQMEQSMKYSNRTSAAAIKRLKTDLELRSKELEALQVEVAQAHTDNKSLWVSLNRKDSVISSKDDIIKVKEADNTSLQMLVKDTNEQHTLKVANLYFAQAQALETAAQRTKFAPRKRKETKREALELYKLSLFLGKSEAQTKIDQLEKELG